MTHAFQEMLSPSLTLPRQLSRALETNKELPLEVEEFVEIGKQEVYRVLVNNIDLRQRVGVFLRGS